MKVLHWKKPARTFIVREKKSMPCFTSSNDKVTLLLGSNAAGDFRLKPVPIYHSENSRAVKNYTISTLTVL